MKSLIQLIPPIADASLETAYIFDIDALRIWAKKFYQLWNREFKNIQIAYSYKTNSLRSITTTLLSQGFGAEVTSFEELNMALNDGFPTSKILVDSPFKNKKLIEFCLMNSIQMQIDNLSEIAAISEVVLAKKKAFKPSLTLRIAHDVKDQSSRFGFSFDELIVAIELLNAIEIIPNGIHVHFGSCIAPTKYFELLQIFDSLEEIGWCRSKIERIDIGGGFPPMDEDSFNIAIQYSAALKAVLTTANIDLKKVIIQIEPGRSITEKFGILYGKIIALKRRDEKTIAVCNLGKNLLPSLGHRPKSIIHHSNSIDPIDTDISYKLYGVQCFENDILLEKFKPNFKLEVGDLIAFTNVGSYDFSTSLIWNKAHPEVHGIVGGKLIKLRGSLSPELLRETDHIIEEVYP